MDFAAELEKLPPYVPPLCKREVLAQGGQIKGRAGAKISTEDCPALAFTMLERANVIR